ncbi:hypothetical protein PUN4_220026 [Paraburkholderia unamae]|nr:hypothetical protein PUN4_220026 [Paraburkholderia unamae]
MVRALLRHSHVLCAVLNVRECRRLEFPISLSEIIQKGFDARIGCDDNPPRKIALF